MKPLPINVIKRIATLALIVGVVLFLMTRHIDISLLLETGGIIAIGLTIFAETGLLIGFFLPGDTLLFAAGFFASQEKISLVGSIVAVFLGAIFGNLLGYEIGRRTGPKLFNKEDALLLNKETVENAQLFYEKHGGKTILFARFIPIVRTLAPIIAGIGKMDYKKFVTYSISGAAIWALVVTLLGYWAGIVVGEYINIDKYLLPLILLATIGTFGVSFWHILRDKKSRDIFFNKIHLYVKNFFKN
jgi:membrane-associated protein